MKGKVVSAVGGVSAPASGEASGWLLLQFAVRQAVGLIPSGFAEYAALIVWSAEAWPDATLPHRCLAPQRHTLASRESLPRWGNFLGCGRNIRFGAVSRKLFVKVALRPPADNID